MNQKQLPTPYYIVFEDKIRKNLELIDMVRKQSEAEIIMAFKANALWRTFPIVREYGFKFTASSLNELQLGNEELNTKAHSYCPVFTDSDIDQFIGGSSHITFNSVAQLKKYGEKARNSGVSVGLRVNPQCSVIETDIYNPALPGSRFGAEASEISQDVIGRIDGLHFHALCESDSSDLVKVLDAFEKQFSHILPHIKWLNMGGGHLMTRAGYDIPLLISTIKNLKAKYPNLQIILEPGSAFMWRTGNLVTSVLDIVEHQGIKTAIIDASFACHMPDCLEMPYKPAITESIGLDAVSDKPTYRVGGNSCLSGDFVGDWSFDAPLNVGDILTFEDMNHYTNVKTTMFNGIKHPDIVLCDSNNQCSYLRRYDYNDYKNRMD